ncbi:hypothetical protein GGR56DRAFT_645958 [Xylariaceae sp. FL0804]|nr:hypothetical protein GGR56DRAFT_645958 [Xylariaceae sp. FL0804]
MWGSSGCVFCFAALVFWAPLCLSWQVPIRFHASFCASLQVLPYPTKLLELSKFAVGGTAKRRKLHLTSRPRASRRGQREPARVSREGFRILEGRPACEPHTRRAASHASSCDVHT